MSIAKLTKKSAVVDVDGTFHDPLYGKKMEPNEFVKNEIFFIFQKFVIFNPSTRP